MCHHAGREGHGGEGGPNDTLVLGFNSLDVVFEHPNQVTLGSHGSSQETRKTKIHTGGRGIGLSTEVRLINLMGNKNILPHTFGMKMRRPWIVMRIILFCVIIVHTK